MKHQVKVSVSKTPKENGVMHFKVVGIRERVLQFLLGSKNKVIVLLPEDSVQEISICQKGGTTHEQNQIIA